MAHRTLHVLKIESYTGEDTYLHCGPIDTMPPVISEETSDEGFLYAVVGIDEVGNAEILDCGYRTPEEALEYWPEAKERSLLPSAST